VIRTTRRFRSLRCCADGWQGLVVENVRVIVEVTYGEDTDAVASEVGRGTCFTIELSLVASA
jgi:hypothetical protein